MVRITPSFVFTLLGLTVSASYPCAVRREIAPCSCRLQEPKLKTIVVACEQMESFSRMVDVLHNKFPPEQDIALKVSHSQLEDLNGHTFKDLGMTVSNLNLNFDDLSYINDSSMIGMEGVEYLSLSDNKFQEVPRQVLRRMPKIKTLDIGRAQISILRNEDFQGLPTLMHLVLPANAIIQIESHSIPRTVARLHLARNFIPDLNNSLRALTDLEWLFLNSNELTTLQDQLPSRAPKLMLLHAAYNRLDSLPVEIRNYPLMDSLFFHNNLIENLNGALQKARRLKRLHLTHNRIQTLADDEFAESEMMDDMQLGHNHLRSLNGAFLHMKKLKTLNLTHNHLREFSLKEIRGLQILKTVDLSHNKIARLTGQMENLVEQETRVEELHLEFNELVALEGALQGIHGLQRLTLHDNKLQHIAPDDLIGLDDLQLLDISNNQLKTLEETSKTFLPRLQDLVARNNYLTTLEDFHGLPALCKADLSNNRIHTLGHDLGSKTQCGGRGLLIVTLFDNPIICQLEFNSTAETMLRNFTLLQGDFSQCPPVTEAITTTPTTTTSTTTSTTPIPSTTTTTATTTTTSTTNDSIREIILSTPEPILTELQTLLRARPPPQVLQLNYNPEMDASLRENNTPVTAEEPQTERPVEELLPSIADIPTQISKPVEMAPVEVPIVDKADVTETLNGQIIVTEMFNPAIIVRKEEGQNLTLVIPMENGVINKDHGVDQYNKKDDAPSLEQANSGAAITNIEIVDINPLPNDFPSIAVPSTQENTPPNPE